MSNKNDALDVNYNRQCLTCNLLDEERKTVHESYLAGHSYNYISTMVESSYDQKISPDAISNHIKKHTHLTKKAPVVSEVQKITQSVAAPKDWSPKVSTNENGGEIITPAKTGDVVITDFNTILDEMGIDRDKFEIEGTPAISKWMRYDGEWLTAYKIRLTKKVSETDIADLIAIVKDVKPLPEQILASNNEGKYAFVFAAGDLQLGKSDTDGTEGIVKRYRESLQNAVNKVHELGDLIGPIVISWVGDCIEGMVSQGGKNARRTELSTTQQVKLLRLLMTETIKAFAPLTNDLRVISVPGNHDEAQREPVATDFSDSWAVDALVAVSEALEFNPEAFGHVTCEVVPYDELTTTIEVAGTTITHAHGHQWKRGQHWAWWSGQAWGGHRPGDADILISGHFHTGSYEQQNMKHMIRTPSFEKESTYFRHRTGLVGNPSAVTFLTRNGTLKYIDFE